jgi:hypothetical protein
MSFECPRYTVESWLEVIKDEDTFPDGHDPLLCLTSSDLERFYQEGGVGFGRY